MAVASRPRWARTETTRASCWKGPRKSLQRHCISLFQRWGLSFQSRNEQPCGFPMKDKRACKDMFFAVISTVSTNRDYRSLLLEGTAEKPVREHMLDLIPAETIQCNMCIIYIYIYIHIYYYYYCYHYMYVCIYIYIYIHIVVLSSLLLLLLVYIYTHIY